LYFKTSEIELYYEKTGQGEPVVLLHGNGEDHTIFDVLVKQLSPDYTVYAIDSRGHGKSGKVESLDYNSMMEDVALFIREMGIQKPIMYGFSDGGIIGLLLAVKYPEMLSKLIISGANTHPDGIKGIHILPMKIVYFFTGSRKNKLMLTQPCITDAELNAIVTPTLVLAGSKDLIKENHTRNIAKNIPGSVLRILEGESHGSYVVKSEKLYEIIKIFITIKVREITTADYPLLEQFLYNAIFLPPGIGPLPRDIIFKPEIFIYIDGFGSKPGDCGVAAEAEGKTIGIAWTRIIPAYGHIDDETPELAVSVLPEYRGQGTGTALLMNLFELLRGRGYSRTSLSVQKENPAVRLYQRVGYKVLYENEEDYIMIKGLNCMNGIVEKGR